MLYSVQSVRLPSSRLGVCDSVTVSVIKRKFDKQRESSI
jgi:hypothetical protein